MDQDRSGFVYVMWKEDTSLFNVGCTETKPKLRPETLNGTVPPAGIIIVHYVYCADFECLKSAALEYLNRFTTTKVQGWFESSLRHAIDALHDGSKKAGAQIFFDRPLLRVSLNGKIEQVEEDPFSASQIVRKVLDLVETRNLELKKYKRMLDDALRELAQRESSGDQLASGQESYASHNFEGKRREIDEKLWVDLKKVKDEALAHVGKNGVAKLETIAESAKYKPPPVLNLNSWGTSHAAAKNIQRRISRNNEKLDRLMKDMGLA